MNKFSSFNFRSSVTRIVACVVFNLIVPNAAKAKTICTITLNSSDEKTTFEKHLGKKFNFVELTPGSETSTSKSSSAHESNKDWFKSACLKAKETNLKCDSLIVSGHFAGAFFGSSGLQLSLEDLEEARCAKSCEGVLNAPSAVYLFGCNTLAGKDKDSRTPEEYLKVLLADGIPTEQARMVVEARYGSTGETNQDRMIRVFGNSPRIYGFSSIGPSGSHVKEYLDKYFLQNPNYEDFIDKISTEREEKDAKKLLERFSLINNKTDDPFQCSLNKTAIACGNGVCMEKGDVSALLCALRDKQTPLKNRLQQLAKILQRKDALAFLPTAKAVIADIDEDGLDVDEKLAFNLIRNNSHLKLSMLTLIKNGSALPSQRMDWIDFAYQFGWIADSKRDEAKLAVMKSLLKNFGSQESRDLFYQHLDEFSAAVQNSDVPNILVPYLAVSPSDTRWSVLNVFESINLDNSIVLKSVASCLDDKDEAVRLKAVSIFKRNLSNSVSVTALLSCLKDPSAVIRSACARSLNEAKVMGPEIQKRLSLLMLNDPVDSVKKAGLDGLKNFKSLEPSTVESIVKLLKSNPGTIRNSAALSLGRPGLTIGIAESALLSCVNDSDPGFRSAAFRALSKLRSENPRVLDALLSGLEDQDVAIRKESLVAAFAYMDKSSKAQDALLKRLSDSDASVRFFTVYVLEQSLKPSSEMIQILQETAKNDPDLSVRTRARSAAKKFLKVMQDQGPRAP